MAPSRTMLSGLILVALTCAAGDASGGTTRDDSRRDAKVTPAAPARDQTIHVAFRARLDSFRATYAIKTVGPRPACANRRKISDAYADGVEKGDRIAFALRAPAKGWCRGTYHVFLIAHADVDTADDECEIVPESGSSDCPEELKPVMAIDRRTRFRVR